LIPALAIQGVLIGAQILYLTTGELDPYVAVSFLLLLLLYALQGTTGEARFLYLYPVNRDTGIPSPSFDTYVLRGFLLAVLASFAGGAAAIEPETEWGFRLHGYLAALLVLIVGGGLPMIWHRTIEPKMVKHLKAKIDHTRQSDELEGIRAKLVER